MCGIVGIISRKKIIKTEIIGPMIDEISHRGPDDSGVWVSISNQAVLGHRRLSIIDLSSSGHQPFLSSDGRYAIIFNGEIYNFKDLKKELEIKGYKFVSSSDTEVLLYSFVEWQEKCLDRLNGMFAFAIWDEEERTLFAARDRLGEKPFKYHISGDEFVFASELKAILKFPDIKREVDWQAIDIAMSFRYVPSPMTGFKDIYKLPAGHYLTWKDGNINIKRYWHLEDAVIDKKKSLTEWKKEIWDLFLDSVKKRLISDIPVGAFLSGGIDSSSVIAAMKEVGAKHIETFVISMSEKSEDQKFAKLAAKHFETNHHEIEINKIDYKAAVEKIVKFYDEPFFDQSALPSILISEEMKKHVTVVLSGDGGDELFGGYDAYKFIRFLKKYHKLPDIFRKKIIPTLFYFSKALQYRAEILAENFFESYSEYYSIWKTSLSKSRKYITKEDLYQADFKKSIDLQKSSKLIEEWFMKRQDDIVNGAMLADINGRLADGYMTKVDIASMASAVEVRPPFLDYRLAEISQRIPSNFKIKGGNAKYIWKEIIKNKLPKEIIDRQKAGFSIPLHLIIKNELKEMVEDNILSENSVISEVFSVRKIKDLWDDHLNGKADYSNHLWSLLILELWLKKYIEK